MSWPRLGTLMPSSFSVARQNALLVHRCDIVEPIEVGQRLQVGLVLDQLFGATMEQADMGIDALNHLAIKLQHEA
jgi:hypothetical protein